MNLITKTKELVAKEKYYTTKVIEHLQLIEDKKVYAELGFNSLYDFCLKELGYSPMQATVRVNCVRICKKHPQVIDKIKSGSISPSSASKAQSFFRKHGIESKTREKILKQIEGKSTRQTERELMKFATKPIEKRITLNERILKKIAKLSQLMGDSSELEIIESLVEEKIQELERKKLVRVERGSNRQRYISRKVKEHVDQRAKNQCEHISANGKRCNARTNLQYDHIRPIYEGGSSSLENIQKLCFSHNQLKNIQNGKSKPK